MKKIALLGLTLFALTGCTVNSQVPTNNTTASNIPVATPEPTPQIISGSLFTLLDGQNKECTWSGTVQDYNINGTIFTSENNFRAEAITKVSLLPLTGYAVGNGETITAWVSLAPEKKVTYSYNELRKVVDDASAQASNPVLSQLAQDHTFTCKTWTPDPNAFNTPK